MKITNSSNGKVNAIAQQLMLEANAETEDHTKTMELLKNLQTAIQENRLKVS